MILGTSRNSVSRSRIIRGVAILFLLYTALDIAYPQLCSEELASLATAAHQTLKVNSHAASHAGFSVAANSGSHQNQPSKQESQEEDCFCCCAHVVAGMVFVPPIALLQNSDVSIRKLSATPQNEFERPYHPPRFS